MTDATLTKTSGATTGSDAEATTSRPVIKFKPQGTDRRSVPAEKVTELTELHRELIDLMVYGFENPQYLDGEYVKRGQPLTLEQAARASGVRTRRARELHRESKLFQTALNEAVRARRDSEGARNLETAIEIRDDKGDGSAAFATARLKAIQSIEGTDRAGVSLTINNTNTQNNLRAGYVMDLTPQTKTIEATATEIEQDA